MTLTHTIPSCWRLLTLCALLLAAGCNPAARQTAAPLSQTSVRCPSVSEVPLAPEAYLGRSNPLTTSAGNIEQGMHLYQSDAKPVACANCHGAEGDGRGPMADQLLPPPTDFTCSELAGVPDGQLFWVIEQGSGFMEELPGHDRETLKRPGRRERTSAMRPHKYYLSETEIWQLVLYIRTFTE